MCQQTCRYSRYLRCWFCLETRDLSVFIFDSVNRFIFKKDNSQSSNKDTRIEVRWVMCIDNELRRVESGRVKPGRAEPSRLDPTRAESYVWYDMIYYIYIIGEVSLFTHASSKARESRLLPEFSAVSLFQSPPDKLLKWQHVKAFLFVWHLFFFVFLFLFSGRIVDSIWRYIHYVSPDRIRVFFAVGPNSLHIRIPQISGISGTNFQGMHRSIPSRSLPHRKGEVYMLYTAIVEFQGIGTYLVVLSREEIHLNARMQKDRSPALCIPWYILRSGCFPVTVTDGRQITRSRSANRWSPLATHLYAPQLHAKPVFPHFERVRQETLWKGISPILNNTIRLHRIK